MHGMDNLHWATTTRFNYSVARYSGSGEKTWYELKHCANKTLTSFWHGCSCPNSSSSLASKHLHKVAFSSTLDYLEKVPVFYLLVYTVS
jgi:hypothetical protein